MQPSIVLKGKVTSIQRVADGKRLTAVTLEKQEGLYSQDTISFYNETLELDETITFTNDSISGFTKQADMRLKPVSADDSIA